MRPRLILSPGAVPVRQTLAGKTILQIIPQLDAGGAERTTIDIADALASVGARALVASEGGRLVSELQARGGVWIPFPAKTKNPLLMMSNIRKLRRLIASEHVDLVHARSRAPAWVALGAAGKAKIPFVTTYHGAYAGKSRLKIAYNSVMARGNVVIANSHFTSRRIQELHPFATDRIRVVHRGTDTAAFKASSVDPARVRKLRAEWGVEPDERVVLLAARLTEWKGQRVLIGAAEKLTRAGIKGLKFILAGDPQGRTGYVRELDTAIAAAGLKDVVRRVGHCADMPAAFMTASVVTVCSTDPEAFGRVAVEAQLFGKPLIVSDLGAVSETVLAPPEVSDDARTGWKVPPGDKDALADGLMVALNLGASELDQLAARARDHVENHFSLPEMCAQTLKIYAELLSVNELS